MPARWTRELAVMTTAALAAIALDAVVEAAPDAGARAGATIRERVAGSGDDLALLLAHKGTMMRARFEGGRLVARDAGGAVIAVRELSDAERAALLAAARTAVDDSAPQWSCPVDETFVSVTVDQHTSSSAVCPDRNHWRAHPELWRPLVTLLRRLFAVRK